MNPLFVDKGKQVELLLLADFVVLGCGSVRRLHVAE